MLFSKRELLLPVRMSVCQSSVVCLEHSCTLLQAIEIFGNVSTLFGILAICDLSIKISRRSPQGNSSVGGGGLKRRGVAEYSDFGTFQAISRKRCKIGGKLVLITNRKSHVSFRLVPKSVILNDLERRNDRYIALFH